MYTLCYTTPEGENKWFRCEDIEDISKILFDEGMFAEEYWDDVLIFTPEADKCMADMEELRMEFFMGDEENEDGEEEE